MVSVTFKSDVKRNKQSWSKNAGSTERIAYPVRLNIAANIL